MQRVPAFQESPVQGKVTCATYGRDFLILGTEDGVITALSRGDNEWTEIATNHTKKDLGIEKIIALDEMNCALALTSGRTVAGYSLDKLETWPKLSMRDVSQFVLEENADPQKPRQQIAIFTSTAIRFLDLTQDSVKVARSIEYPDIIKGCWIDTKLLLATKDTYELLDLSKDSKIPLFPVAPGLEPILGIAGPTEFLVVQGTAMEDVAMGLIVTDGGEVARQGDVIMWDTYPSQAVVINCTYLLSVVKSQLLIHSLKTKIELLEHDFGDRPVVRVFDFPGPLIPNEQLTTKLGRPCSTRAMALIVYEDGMDWWLPPSDFSRVETGILEGEIEEISPNMIDIGNEQGVWELEYLSLLLALQLLVSKEYTKAVGAWLDGIKLDSGIVLFLFGDGTAPSTFPGLKGILDQLEGLRSDQAALRFYRTFLRAQIKRHSDVAKFEIHYAKLLQGSSYIQFIAKDATASFDQLIEQLRTTEQFDVLEKVYTQRQMSSELVDLWTEALKGSIPLDKEASAKKLSEVLQNSEDEDLVWRKALEVTSLDVNTGLNILKTTKVRFDEQRVLDALKQQGELAWRSYLKYLVYEVKNPSFAADLTTIIAADLVEGSKTPQVSKFIKKLYKEYTELPHPKRSFYEYIVKQKERQQQHKVIYEFLQLELDFWHLLCRPEADLASLTALLDENARHLIIERSALYSYLGLHTQCIELLDEIKDYQSLFYYCEYGRPAPPPSVTLDKQRPRMQLDLTKEVFRQLTHGSRNVHVVSELLRLKASDISVDLALEYLPSEWAASEFSEYFSYHLKHISSEKRQSMLLRGVAKYENSMISSEVVRQTKVNE